MRVSRDLIVLRRRCRQNFATDLVLIDRSLTDNAPDVMFSIAAKTPIRLGIGKGSVTSKPPTNFPYVPVVTLESQSAVA